VRNPQAQKVAGPLKKHKLGTFPEVAACKTHFTSTQTRPLFGSWCAFIILERRDVESI